MTVAPLLPKRRVHEGTNAAPDHPHLRSNASARDLIGKECHQASTEFHTREVTPAVASHISPETSPIVRRHDTRHTFLLEYEFTLAAISRKSQNTASVHAGPQSIHQKRNDNARAQPCFSGEASYATLEKFTSCAAVSPNAEMDVRCDG